MHDRNLACNEDAKENGVSCFALLFVAKTAPGRPRQPHLARSAGKSRTART